MDVKGRFGGQEGKGCNFVHEIRRFCGQSDEIDGIGHKIGPFLGREGLNDSSGQKKAPFSGRKGSKEKRDTPKGCLRKLPIPSSVLRTVRQSAYDP